MGDLLVFAFAAIQGAVIFTTAYAGLRLFKTSHWLAKILAMAVSYLLWIMITLAGYTMAGGEGGLMDGMGLVLFLFFTALVSSLVYLLTWLAFGVVKQKQGSR